MIRVLHIICALNDGGIERLLYNYYQYFDTNEIIFDFAVNNDTDSHLKKYFLDRGSKVYTYTQIRKNPYKAYEDLKTIIDNESYDIIHSHLADRAFPVLKYARDKGVNTIISHGHSANYDESLISKFLRCISTKLTKKYSTDLFACGIEAAKWTWGEKMFLEEKTFIMRNAIEVKRFAFSETIRENTRRKLGLEGKHVLLCVGRLSVQKNQLFLIDLFEKIYQHNPLAVLVLAGDGELRNKIEERIKEKGLCQAVQILGVRNDIEDLLCAADCYILPSIYEGLPISVIEACCSGLGCVLSNNITNEVKLSDSVVYCSLNDYSAWIKEVENCINNSRNIEKRYKGIDVVKSNGYDIETEALSIEKYYFDLSGGKKCQ